MEGVGEEGREEGGRDCFGAFFLSSFFPLRPSERFIVIQALSDTFFWDFWSAGIYKIVGDLAQTTSPLVTRKIIQEVQAAYNASRAGQPLPGIGLGIGLAFVLLVQQMYVVCSSPRSLFFVSVLSSAHHPSPPRNGSIYSVCTNNTFSRSGQVGILARGALIAAACKFFLLLLLSLVSRLTVPPYAF